MRLIHDTCPQRKKNATLAHLHHIVSVFHRPIGIRIARVAMGDGLLMEQVLGDSHLNQRRPHDLSVNIGCGGSDRVLLAGSIGPLEN